MGVVAGLLTPNASSSVMCFSTAAASRPVQPATIASSMPTSRAIAVPLFCSVRDRVWRATETPIGDWLDGSGWSASKFYPGGGTAQDRQRQSLRVLKYPIARSMLQRRTLSGAMREMSVREANQDFSQPIAAAEHGETIIFAQTWTPV